MRRIEQPPATVLTRKAGTYSRLSLDASYAAWYAPFPGTVAGDTAFKVWSMAPNALSGSGTIHREEDVARREVEYFMEVSVPRQREESAGHTLPSDRLAYVNGQLTVIDSAAQYHGYFSTPEAPDQEPGSVGGVIAIATGLGDFYLRRHKRLVIGDLQKQYPDPEVEALLRPLYTHDIHANSWGADDEGAWYPVAADIANAAFPGTYPPYEPRRLTEDEEAMVLRRRRAGFVGDPVAGRATEEERLSSQEQAHREAKARQSDVPLLYEL